MLSPPMMLLLVVAVVVRIGGGKAAGGWLSLDAVAAAVAVVVVAVVAVDVDAAIKGSASLKKNGLVGSTVRKSSFNPLPCVLVPNHGPRESPYYRYVSVPRTTNKTTQ
jgi:hypothetical protein